MNKNESDIENLNIIPDYKWIDHYNAFWYNDDVKADHNIETNNVVTYEEDFITMHELEVEKPLEEPK